MGEALKLAFEWLRGLDFKGSLLPWLPSAFTLFGWHVVNRQNNKRETRKEERAAADRCKVLAREVAQHGIEYWSGSVEVKPWKIRAGFEELEVEIERFKSACMRKNLLSLQVELVDAVMGHNFDQMNFKAVAQDHPVFKEIAAARQRLLFAVEREFSKQCCCFLQRLFTTFRRCYAWLSMRSLLRRPD